MKKDRIEAVTVPMQQLPNAIEGKDERASKTSDLQDRRHGAYDSVTDENSDDSLPEGLRRTRKGPLSPTRGRSTEKANAKR
jgi:hypothetical protein